ncbi:MAG: dihydrodipicolinate synthase family protein, partial [Rikenellaceae bacterium]
MYNVPGRTGVNMTAATCLRLAKEFPNIIAIKEASGNISQVSYILRDAPKDFTVISGEDNLSLAIIAAGGDGVISVSANAFPKKFTTLVASALKGDYITAQRCQNELLEVTDLLFAEGNPVGVKSALSTIGIIKNVLRLPLVKSTVELDAKIAAHIKKYNLQ